MLDSTVVQQLTNQLLSILRTNTDPQTKLAIMYMVLSNKPEVQTLDLAKCLAVHGSVIDTIGKVFRALSIGGYRGGVLRLTDPSILELMASLHLVRSITEQATTADVQSLPVKRKRSN